MQLNAVTKSCFLFFFQKSQKLISEGGGGRFVYLGRYSTWPVQVEKVETRLSSKQFDYYFIIFIFDMNYSFFIGSDSFGIVECGV